MVAIELPSADTQLAGGGPRIQCLAVAIVQQTIAAPVQRIGRHVGAGAQLVHGIQQRLLQSKSLFLGAASLQRSQREQGMVAQIDDIMKMPKRILEVLCETLSRRHQ